MDVKSPIVTLRSSFQEMTSRTELADAGPFDVNGAVKQGYLFRVEPHATLPMFEFLVPRVPDLFISPTPSSGSPFDDGETRMHLDDNPIHDLLISAKNVVLEGVPGTGKSYAIERFAHEWERRTGRSLVSVWASRSLRR